MAWRSPNPPVPWKSQHRTNPSSPWSHLWDREDRDQLRFTLVGAELSSLLGISWPDLSKFSQSQRQKEPPAVPSLQCHDLPGIGCIIIFMHLFIDGEILPKHVFLEEPGGQEEEAGPDVGNYHRPSRRCLCSRGKPNIPKFFYSQGSAKGSAGGNEDSASIFIQTSQESKQLKEKSHISRHHSAQGSSALDVMAQGMFPAQVSLTPQ